MTSCNPHILSMVTPTQAVSEVTVPPTQAPAVEMAETTMMDYVYSVWAAPWCPWVILGLFVILILWIAILHRRTMRRKKVMTPIPKTIDTATGTITSLRVGKVHGQGARDYQQDSFGISDPERLSTNGVLAVVADGMGGLQNGGEISSIAVETILDGFLYSQGQGTPEQVLLTLTQWAVRAVNTLLGPDQYRKSGSTLVMGLVKNGMFSWVSIGDSRICLFRDGNLIQLTREHDFKQTLALQAINGEIPMQEVYTDKRKDGLISYLGMGAVEHIDFPANALTLRPGDRLVLMSDGVYNALEDWELVNALGLEPEAAAQAMEAAITQKGYQNQDNYTAVILSYQEEPVPAQQNEEGRDPV